jgi:hypothetical protein
LAFLTGLLLWYVGCGAFRCYGYYKVIACRPGGLQSLRGRLTKLDIPASSNDVEVLSLGYSQLAIPSNLAYQVEYVSDADAVSVTVGEEDCRVHLLSPYYSDRPATDPNARLSSPSPSIFGLDPSGYEFAVRAANTKPKKYSEIFFMPRIEFLEYFVLATAKSQRSLNQEGIGIFETPHIKGIVRFGKSEVPDFFEAEIFCKQSDIRQTVYFNSKTAEANRELLFSILASYKFIITEVPDEHILKNLILEELEKHDKFEQPD